MFIIEEPYISELMLKTLEKNQIAVLDTELARSYGYNLNYVKEEKTEEPVIYSNSENAINYVLKTYPKSDLAKIINICKDKYEFRNRLQPLYPDFFFEEILLEDMEDYDIAELPIPFIIKPTVGFLSMGVHKVTSYDEWEKVINKIKEESKEFGKLFPKDVLNSSGFIMEEIIEGKEYAVDAYYNNSGKAVILNIFEHPFVNSTDVSDRAYITSADIIRSNLANFQTILDNIGETLSIKNFPIHIEFRITKSGKAIPIEINPMRFAGWCTTDLAYYAYGINIYEYFYKQQTPDWSKILQDQNNEIYYFAMANMPDELSCEQIKLFDYDLFRQNFSDIMEFRKIDYHTKPMFAILFGKTNKDSEITKILQLDLKNYIEVNYDTKM